MRSLTEEEIKWRGDRADATLRAHFAKQDVLAEDEIEPRIASLRKSWEAKARSGAVTSIPKPVDN